MRGRSLCAVLASALLCSAGLAVASRAEAAVKGPGRYQTSQWILTTGSSTCVAEKTWFQYNNGLAQNMAAYGSWGVSADGLAPHRTITQADPNFYALNRLGPIQTAPTGCTQANPVPAGWIASRYHVLKWNGSSWAHCQGVPYYYSTSTSFEFAVTTPSGQTGTSAPVLCGSGYYYAESQSWVWDGAAWRGGYLQQAPAGADYVNVTQSTYAYINGATATDASGAAAGAAPTAPKVGQGDVIGVVDSNGLAVRDKTGRAVTLVVDLGPPTVTPAATPGRFTAVGLLPAGGVTRTVVDGIETVTVTPVSDAAKRAGLVYG